VKDVVRAIVRAIEKNAPGVYNIACGRRINRLELAAMIEEITGISVPIIFAPPAKGDVRDSVADSKRAQEAFGYAPEYTVKTGLEETITWYRNR
jgi:UDP-glucose 4-epimerase